MIPRVPAPACQSEALGSISVNDSPASLQDVAAPVPTGRRRRVAEVDPLAHPLGDPLGLPEPLAAPGLSSSSLELER